MRLSQSGLNVGSRHIAHLGNRRLQWLLYCMAEETAKWVPEVRLKILRRQLGIPNIERTLLHLLHGLKLIMALVISSVHIHCAARIYDQLRPCRTTSCSTKGGTSKTKETRSIKFLKQRK